MNIQRINEAIDRAESVLDSNRGGSSNPTAVATIKEQIWIILAEAGHIAYVSQKASSSDEFAERLYSQRRWKDYGDAESVWNFVFQDLGRVRSEVESR